MSDSVGIFPIDPRLMEPLSERDRQEAMRAAFRTKFKDDDDLAWWAHDNARALARYEATVTALTARLTVLEAALEKVRDADVWTHGHGAHFDLVQYMRAIARAALEGQ